MVRISVDCSAAVFTAAVRVRDRGCTAPRAYDSHPDTGLFCFLISQTEFSVLHVILYTFIVTLVAFAAGTVMTLLPIRTARSKIFSAILPVYLILSFLFSGILMDLTNFGTALRTLSRLFPPSMF